MHGINKSIPRASGLLFLYLVHSTFSMRWMKWTGVAAAVLLIISCFTPWVIIESKNITISGIDATGTSFGKPGYFHLLMSFFFILFSFIPRVWSKRSNILVIAMNFAWAVRNYFSITACEGGECPVKKTGIYLILLASVLMMAAALFPDMKLPGEKEKR
jgi:hypothetical protein